MARFDLALKGGECVMPWGVVRADIGIRAGRIAAIGDLTQAEAAQTVDCKGLHLLPGLIDPHVHLRDPGDPKVETMETGTRAAVLGGLAAVFDMPNTTPSITNTERLNAKREFVTGHAWCDIGIYVGGTKTNIAELGALELEPNVCAIKIFAGSSTGDLLVEDDESLEAVMRSGRRAICYHSEDEYRLQARKPMFTPGMPHIKHQEWRDVGRLGGYAVMNPPIRDARHLEAAWKAVADGTVDCVGSDHAPHSRAAKERPWPDTAAGLTGIQTIVPLMLDHVSAGRLSLPRLADLMCAGPARIYGAKTKGRLAVGLDGDVTVVDMKKTRTIEDSWIVSPCGWTPFAGHRCSGWPVMTVVRGHIAMRDDEVQGAPQGRPVEFIDTRRA